MSYTPGPWEIRAEDPAIDNEGWLVVTNRGDTVASIEPKLTEREEIANARLCAAAPELILALEDLSFACFAGIGTRAPNVDVYNRTFAVLDRVRRQIGIATIRARETPIPLGSSNDTETSR